MKTLLKEFFDDIPALAISILLIIVSKINYQVWQGKIGLWVGVTVLTITVISFLKNCWEAIIKNN